MIFFHILLFLSPILLIFVPIYIVNKIRKEVTGSEYTNFQIFILTLLLALNPYIHNAILYFFHPSYFYFLTLPLLVLFFLKNSYIYYLSLAASLSVKEDSILWTSLTVFYVYLITIFFKNTFRNKMLFISFIVVLVYAYSLSLFRNSYQQVEYQDLQTFNIDNKTIIIQTFLYAPIDIISLGLGNFISPIVFLLKNLNKHTASPIYHHGILIPLFTLITLSLYHFKYTIITFLITISISLININLPNNDSLYYPSRLFNTGLSLQQQNIKYQHEQDLNQLIQQSKNLDYIATDLRLTPFFINKNLQILLNVPPYPPTKKPYHKPIQYYILIKNNCYIFDCTSFKHLPIYFQNKTYIIYTNL